jgi:amidase
MWEVARRDATGQAELVRDSHVSPAELVESAIGRIEALNPELNAVISDLSEGTSCRRARPRGSGCTPAA